MAVFWAVNFHQPTRRFNPEDSHLRTHRRENLKSHLNYLGLYRMVYEKQETHYSKTCS
jgi:hypothetical protein